MIWREKRVLLIVLAVLLAANAIFFFTYRVRYQSRLDDLDARMAQAEGQLAQARGARIRAEETYRGYKRTEADVATIYNQYWATQSERLTTMIAEVKKLTVAASLIPSSTGYGRHEVAAKVLTRRDRANQPRSENTMGATEVGITFGVTGSYEQVRRLINLLELSRQFIIIEQIGLSEGEGGKVSFNLNLKTLFRDDENPRAANNRL